MRSRRGFTLIEVMVAAAVLGIAATALFSLLSRSLWNLRKVQDVHHYQLAAQEMMNRVSLLTNLPPGGRVEGPVKNADGSERQNVRWVVTVSPWIPEKLDNNPPEAVMKVDVEVVWPGQFGQRSLKLETVKATALSYNNYDFQTAIESVLPN